MSFTVSVAFCFLTVALLETSAKSAVKKAEKPQVVYKVHCPNDKKLRKMITTRAEGENFIVECSKPMVPTDKGNFWVAACFFSFTLSFNHDLKIARSIHRCWKPSSRFVEWSR